MSYKVIVKNKRKDEKEIKYVKGNPPDQDQLLTLVSNTVTDPPVILTPTETLKVQTELPSVDKPVFLAIDSKSSYNIKVTRTETNQNIEWNLVFINPQAQSGTLLKTVSDVKGDPPVNVTVGQDEPSKIPLLKANAMLNQSICYTRIAAFMTPVLFVFSNLIRLPEVIQYVVSGALGIGIISLCFLSVNKLKDVKKIIKEILGEEIKR